MGTLGGMEEGIRALGPAPQGTEMMENGWRFWGKGDGVKGKDVVSLEFENSAGRDSEAGGREGGRRH